MHHILIAPCVWKAHSRKSGSVPAPGLLGLAGGCHNGPAASSCPSQLMGTFCCELSSGSPAPKPAGAQLVVLCKRPAHELQFPSASDEASKHPSKQASKQASERASYVSKHKYIVRLAETND